MHRATLPPSNACLRMTAALVGMALAATACVTVEGQTSAEWKDKLQSSYLYKAVKHFYPQGVPEDPGQVYPDLGQSEMRAMEEELQLLSVNLLQAHARRAPYVLKLTRWSHMTTPPKPRVMVQRTLQPTIYASPDGSITVDVRVLQAIFRGAVVSAGGTGAEGALFSGIGAMMGLGSEPERPEPQDPGLQTEAQRKVLQSVVDDVRRIDRIPGGGALGDVAGVIRDGTDSPWHRMTELAMASQPLEITYTGAVLFMMAHEMGHLALGHHQQHAELQRHKGVSTGPDNDTYCEQRRGFETEADAYAMLMLTRLLDGRDSGSAAADLVGMNRITGYDSFFRYGYPLVAFGEEDSCSYPSAAERWAQLHAEEKALRDLLKILAAESAKDAEQSMKPPLDATPTGRASIPRSTQGD